MTTSRHVEPDHLRLRAGTDTGDGKLGTLPCGSGYPA